MNLHYNNYNFILYAHKICNLIYSMRNVDSCLPDAPVLYMKWLVVVIAIILVDSVNSRRNYSGIGIRAKYRKTVDIFTYLWLFWSVLKNVLLYVYL